MIVIAISSTLAIDDDCESVKDRWLYITPGTFELGVEPILKTRVIEFDVRKATLEAAEQGPK